MRIHCIHKTILKLISCLHHSSWIQKLRLDRPWNSFGIFTKNVMGRKKFGNNDLLVQRGCSLICCILSAVTSLNCIAYSQGTRVILNHFNILICWNNCTTQYIYCKYLCLIIEYCGRHFYVIQKYWSTNCIFKRPILLFQILSSFLHA